MKNFFKSKWLWGIIILVLLAGGYLFFKHRGGTSYQYVTVTQGPITETVSVTGNTTPTQSVSLGFQNAGTIARVNYSLGDTVKAGDVIAGLNTASLSASLQQAQANVAAQQAQLAGLEAGSQPADIAASQAALQLAQQDLANLYGSIDDAATSAYTSANDAVRTQISTLFSNAETNQPQLTFLTSDSQGAIDADSLRISASVQLNAWQAQLASISSSSTSADLAGDINSDLSYLAVIQNLLNTVSATLDGNINLSASQLATDEADTAAGLTEVNAAVSSLNTISQNIASQEASVAQAQAELALKQAGSTAQAIAAQQAQVEQAQAEVASAEANLQNAELVAPIAGVLTQQDAKIGQEATPGTPLVSIIGNGGYETDVGVSDTDVGKLAIGDPVTMTLDAFPGDTFTGSIFYIAPAETNTNGVITYLTKVSFDKADARLKSGLTVNLDIQTDHVDSALILPQYAILQNDQGTFVETVQNGAVVNVPVTLGIQDENGNVEITSGVTAAQQVLNVGLKSQ